MMKRQFRQDRLPLIGQIDIDLAPVRFPPPAHHQVPFFKPVDEFHRRVMADLHPLSQLPDGRLAVDR